ncbi:S41 family peptidase [Mesobacillus zeae]|uniref:C-terminal processing peptidase n=1 Tax=Mesobacillus zeae TaxID=1917180 RepID=A0A398B4B5_9BACI|nr:S41 family peptidase [Mesobacillus zeae]RID84889.1 PDZ domain-containing protein [Mesobacillus zeae]
MKQKWTALLMVCSLAVGSGGTYAAMGWSELWSSSAEEVMQQQAKPAKSDEERLDKVGQAYSLILNSYVEKVGEEQLVEGAIQGMLSTLKDPYSVYMNKETAKQFSDTLESTFEGIGAEVSKVDDKIVIVSPFKGSPAEKAGLKPNDQILKVDGHSVAGLDLYEATLKIRGEKGTMVKLEVARKGLKEPLEVSVKRDEIPQITVYSDMKKHHGEKIGYVEVTSFSENTAYEFKKELASLEKKGMDALLIDVRGNPGGLLSSVGEILKQLVPEGKALYQIEERNGEKTRYASPLKEAKNYPLGVLVDKGSASASEILAGSLKEAGGYPVIGEKTFGKGTVQQAVPMRDGSNIKLTLFKWLTPDGNWIHKKGVKPTVAVKQPGLYRTHPIKADVSLKQDMNNEQVKNAQEILTGIGFAPGRTDGYFSEQTETAVKAYQKKNGIKATGIIDEKTAAALEETARKEMKKEENDAQLQAAMTLLAK